MRQLFGKLYGAWFYPVFAGSFLLLYPLFAWFLRKPSGYRSANRLRRFWAHLVFLGMGMPWRITHLAELDPDQQYIFCPNHSSNLDIPLFALSWRGHYRFLAKKEWGEVPIFGIFFRTVDLPVDRFSTTGAYKAFVASDEALKAGDSLVVFPEGRMYADGPFTEPFKNGPFRLAIRNGVPIVPITFLDNWRLFPREGIKRGARAGMARAIVHQPVPVDGLTEADADMLRDRVRALVEEPLRETWSPAEGVVSGA